MATFGLLQLGLLLLCFVAYTFVRNLLRLYQSKKFAKANGCEEPFNISGDGPLAFLDGWRRMGRVRNTLERGEDLLDNLFADQFKDANTVKQTQFEGSKLLVTIEPANLQAMLAA